MSTEVPGFGSILMESNEITEVLSTIETFNNCKMVEWGSGGSTSLWFSKLLEVNQNDDQPVLCSIEHNSSWYSRVQVNMLEKYQKHELKRLHYFHEPIQHQQVGYQHTYSTILEEHPFGLKNYIFPARDGFAEFVENADVFFIDGISRSCVASAIWPLAKETAIFYIHDYQGRELWYDWFTSLPYIKNKQAIKHTTLFKFSKTKLPD